MLTVQDIRRAADDRADTVLHALGLAPIGRAGYVCMCNPMRKDTRPSLAIWHKNGTLSFKDYATDEAGDVLGLVAYFKGWYHQDKKGLAPTCRFLTDLLRLGVVTPDELARDRAAARRRQEDARITAAADHARAAAAAAAMFFNAKPLSGSLAETYLRDARGIDVQRLLRGPRGGSRMPGVLRFDPRHWHKESAAYWPCMLAACVDYAGTTDMPAHMERPGVKAVHRTWLAHDGSDKAPVEPQRKVWPASKGLVVPVWRGDGNLSVGEAARCGLRQTLFLTEGIEDGLSAALFAPQFRVWAMISLGNMAHVPIPVCIDGVLIHRQDDWNNVQAVQLFERGKRAIEATGRAVAEVKPWRGAADLNEMLRGIGESLNAG